MSELSKSGFETKFNDASTGLYKDGQVRGIGSDDHRALVTDLVQSSLFIQDDLTKIFQLITAEASVGSNDYTLIFPYDIINPTDHYVFVASFNQANTGPVNLVINSIPIVLKKKDAIGSLVNLVAGDIKDSNYLISYNGSLYVLISGIGSISDRELQVTVPSGAIKVSNTTPFQLIAAPGAGKGYIVDQVIFIMDYNSIPYATNTNFQIKIGGTIIVEDSFNYLASTEDIIVAFSIPVCPTMINQLIYFSVKDGDPTAGNSDVRIILTLKTITI